MRLGLLLRATLLLALMAFGVPAGATPFTGTVSIWGIPTLGLAGDGTSAPSLVTVPTGATTFTASFAIVTTPVPGGYVLRQNQKVTGAGAGSFSGTPLAGPMAFQGAMVGTLTNLGGFQIVSLPLTSAGTRGVGLGGTVTAISYSAAVWSVQGAPWTTGPAVATNVRPTPAASPMTVTLTGYDNRTAGGNGEVQLVTPIQFNFAGTPAGTHGVMTLSFVPEPGGLLLLGGGIAAFAACAFLFPPRR